MTIRLVPANEFLVKDLAALFTKAYEGYFVPIEVDEATMSEFIELWDIDLRRSRVALDNDQPAGIANLALRGNCGWIAGIGVAANARRRGIARALMKALLVEAPATVSLEVIDQNGPAIALYAQLGFETRRTLEVWTLTADVGAVEAKEVAAKSLGQVGLPWQRADDSLPPDTVCLAVGEGAVIVRVRGSMVSVFQLAAPDVDVATKLLMAARARGAALRFVNVPEGDVASEALAQLGATLQLRQLEMLLRR